MQKQANRPWRSMLSPETHQSTHGKLLCEGSSFTSQEETWASFFSSLPPFLPSFFVCHYKIALVKLELPYEPAIPLVGIYPEKTIIQKDTCTRMFIAALFTIARTWKQAKCPSTDEWIKKMWHIYTMEYQSAIQRNEIELFVVRWMDLESVILSEVSQKEKNKYHMLTHIYGI